MTKNEFKDIVKRGFFSCKWRKNDGTIGKIKLGVLGKLGYRFTQEKRVTEHPNYASCIQTECEGDFDGDGIVGAEDLLTFLSNYGECD